MLLAFNAQAQNYEDVIYLKNGSVIRGIIIEQVPNETMKIQTRDGNVFVYNIIDIQKITKELPFNKQGTYAYKNNNYSKPNVSQFNKPNGYFGLAEVGIAPGVNYEPLRISATVINGYRFAPQFAIGVGVGLQGYVDYGELTIPLYLHLRSDFLDRKTSPFLAFNIGYNLSVLGGYFGGLMMEPIVGASFNVGNKYRMAAGLGVALDRVKGTIVYGDYYYSSFRAFSCALNLKVGFSF